MNLQPPLTQSLSFIQLNFKPYFFSSINPILSGGLLAEIKADVEKQLELVMTASKHGENVGTDRTTLDSAKADLDSAIAKLRTIESLVRYHKY